MSEDLKYHPISKVFPLMEQGDLQGLSDDIRQNGLREPVWLYEGMILDGRNRNLACKLAGVKVHTKEFIGTHSDALHFVWSLNRKRRHLDPGQIAACETLRERLDEEYAKEIKKIKDEQSKGGRPKAILPNHPKPVQKIAPVNPMDLKTSTKRAKAAGTNRTYLEAAAKLPTAELEAVRDGKKKITDVIRESKRKDLKARLDDIQVQEVKALEGVYDIIVIDPPWPMEKIERDERPNQSEMDYPTMTELELAKIHLPLADDCHVWLWTTQRFLPMAFRLLESWNMKYVCTFVWHKPGGFQPIGLPQYNCEFALYARWGFPKFLETKALPTCFEAPRGKHSEKPEEFYELLRRVTAGRRVDMFNRREIKGFDRWGNET